MSKEEGIRRMKDVGKLFTLTGVGVPVMSFTILEAGNKTVWELCIFTLPLWALMLLAGVVLWVTAFIKEGYLK